MYGHLVTSTLGGNFGTNKYSHTVLIGVVETVFTTGYRILRDWIVYDEAWDGTVEELVLNPSSGDQRDIFEDCESK